MATDEQKELSGLARSIDALFAAEAPRSTAGKIVWEKDDGVRRPPASDADPEALRAAVTAFLAAGPLEREGRARAIRDAAAALREAKALDALSDSVERLVQGGGDPPDEACMAVAHALLTPVVASRIVARLGATQDDERRAELVLLCQRLGHEIALAIADALSETRNRVARGTYLDTLVSMGSEAMVIAEQMLAHPRWFVVRDAAAILGEIEGERSIELLVSTLAHADARVRAEVLLALAKVGGEDAGMLAYGMIEDPDPGVRLAAATAAGALKVERAIKPLLSVLESEERPDVVVGVLDALGRLGDPGAVAAIQKRAVASFFSRQPADVRIAAYQALHRIGTPHAKSLLVQAADDKVPEVRTAVRHLLGMR
ncbi:MAG TPA: HEAT repeat domain-containing protein [Longimicrobiales bacterium]|nr:HEAT repeat domain-containing protein [Longimicrobiales bacterium]